MNMDLKSVIRDIPDFPKKGILFKDITPLLQSPQAFTAAIDKLADYYKNSHVDLVFGAEARGFIIGGALAYRLEAGFIPARKPGKLPYLTEAATYDLEYGQDSLEVHRDAICPSQHVLIVDDVLATGGTAKAKAELVEKLGGEIVGLAFLVELSFLKGRQKLSPYPVFSLVKYQS